MKPIDWSSHPVDVLLELWPADRPKPSAEMEAELRGLCDQPVEEPRGRIYGRVRIHAYMLQRYLLEPPEDYSVSQADNTGHVIITHLPSSSPG